MSNLTEGSALKVDDLQSMAEPYLTEKTKQALSKVEKRLSILRADSEGRGYVYAQCLYIGKKSPLSKIEDAVKFVAEKVNELGEAGEIVSRLSHFIKVDLSQESTGYFNEDGSPKEQECVVVCYIHVPLATYDRAMADKKNYAAFCEGEMPE